jgi:hypothetical protein
MIFVTLILFGLVTAECRGAQDGQVLLTGRVKSIDLAGNSVVVTDYKGRDVTLSIESESIMKKFRDRLIKVGDDVTVKYSEKEGKNVCLSFRKTEGC